MGLYVRKTGKYYRREGKKVRCYEPGEPIEINDTSRMGSIRKEFRRYKGEKEDGSTVKKFKRNQ